jgi:hypothetical protein
LPHDPAGFFGLAAGFSRIDLKRGYGQMLRRFRPEQFPAEFQKIRAAYEQLDLELRYGATSGDGFEGGSTSSTANAPFSPVAYTTSLAAAREDAASIVERIRRESPAAVYQALTQQPIKSSADYYALAILSDVVEPQGDVVFVRWLFEGLSKAPHDAGLHLVLRNYFHGAIDDDSLAPVLVLASQHISEQAFFRATERLWHLLLQKKGFGTFRQTLAAIEKTLPGLRIESRIAFLLQILRVALWEAEIDWIDDSLRFVEENFPHIPPQLENEIDLLVVLRNYVARRAEFLGGHMLRGRMDAALRSYFVDDELASDKTILDLQRELLKNPDALRVAFPDNEEPGLHEFYCLWSWASRDVQLRNVDDDASTEPSDLWFEQTWKILNSLEGSARWSLPGLRWSLGQAAFTVFAVSNYFTVPILLTLVVTIVVISLGLNNRHQDPILGIGAILCILGGLYLGHLLNKKFVHVWQNQFVTRAARRSYQRQWQGEVFAFIGRTHLTVPQFLAYLAACPTRSATRDWLHFHVERDYGLAFYSIAQRFIV